MARTKTDLARDEKELHIRAVARRMFVEFGYDVSVNRIAEEAGVAPNTLYWYFADKDALLIAVLDQIVAEGAREFAARRRGTLEAQVVWLLGVLEGVENLIATVHARLALSESLRTWHTNFHRMGEAALLAQLQSHGVPSADLEHAARVAMFVIEGLLAHPTSTKDRRALVRWLVSMVPTTAQRA
ncbi:MAG TPA: helix-turn-helix domain-containing protein [Polyangiaceae bacterium]